MAPPRGGSVEFQLDISGLALTAAGRGGTRPSMAPARGGSGEFHLDTSELVRPPLAEVELGPPWHLRGVGVSSSISTSASLPDRRWPRWNSALHGICEGWECRVPSRHRRACLDRRGLRRNWAVQRSCAAWG